MRYQLRHEQHNENHIEAKAIAAIQTFADALPEIRRQLDADMLAAFQGDPAARNVDEDLLCYPGGLAMIHHRIAHEFYKLELPLLARLSSELAQPKTGIDIHPGAPISPTLFIARQSAVLG